LGHSEVLEIGLVFSVVLIFHVPDRLSFMIVKHNSEENEKQQNNVMNRTSFVPKLRPDHDQENLCI
jgi:hypothetical protein